VNKTELRIGPVEKGEKKPPRATIKRPPSPYKKPHYSSTHFFLSTPIAKTMATTPPQPSSGPINYVRIRNCTATSIPQPTIEESVTVILRRKHPKTYLKNHRAPMARWDKSMTTSRRSKQLPTSQISIKFTLGSLLNNFRATYLSWSIYKAIDSEIKVYSTSKSWRRFTTHDPT